MGTIRRATEVSIVHLWSSLMKFLKGLRKDERRICD
jgi:hypothetical protein